MSACCRRATAAATTPAELHHIPRRAPASSVNYLHVNHRKFWERRGAVGVGVVLRSRRWVIEAAVAGGEEEEEVKRRGQPPRCCSFDGEAVALAKSNGEDVDRGGGGGCSGGYGGAWSGESGAVQARISSSQALSFLSCSARYFRVILRFFLALTTISFSCHSVS
ncbi:UNVERIFIED_CONTAM: hypothetical protein Sradi_0240200 [Sesamum radiatum]|uniref:Uncharacterized protein n=1 Tax=Sesamum radiatum TaxID=300843 RepID=A0AAW2W1S1_SESRA